MLRRFQRPSFWLVWLASFQPRRRGGAAVDRVAAHAHHGHHASETCRGNWDPGTWKSAVFPSARGHGPELTPGAQQHGGSLTARRCRTGRTGRSTRAISASPTRDCRANWAEVFIHAKEKHVDAAVGWMGIGFSRSSFRNPDGSMGTGRGLSRARHDFAVADLKPNIALTVGAFGRALGFREVRHLHARALSPNREQLKLTVLLPSGLTVSVVPRFWYRP